MSRKFSDHSSGFTLLELMITLAIVITLASLAAPSFNDVIKNNRLITQVNDLSSSLNLARSEAIKRSLTVTICQSDNGTSCGGNWQNGWIIFEDVNGNGSVTTGDIIIKVNSAVSSGNTLASGVTEIIYQADGFYLGSSSTFIFCDDRGSDYAKGLEISTTGRVRTLNSSELTSCT